MSKIIGVTVGTSISPKTLKEKLKPVLSVNGVKPDENGNAEIIMKFEDLTEEEKASLKGDKGDTPEKGIDYFTEADKQEMIASVIASLPVYNGEVVAE